jgi:hypothetical protein
MRLFRTLLHGLRNLIRWFPLVWKDADWDHIFLLELMEQKMTWMAEYHEQHGHTVSAPRTARQLRVAARLCARIRRDKYYDNAVASGASVHDALESAALVQKMDKYLLGKVLARHVDTWWD